MGIITSDRTQNIQNEHHSACWSTFFIIYPKMVWSTEHTDAELQALTTQPHCSDKVTKALISWWKLKEIQTCQQNSFTCFFLNLSSIISLRFITKVNTFLSADKLKQTDVQIYQRKQETRFISHLPFYFILTLSHLSLLKMYFTAL